MELREFGIVGLGVMGRNLALNFLSKEVKLAVYNRQVAGVEVDLAKKFAAENPKAVGFDDLAQFVGSLRTPRRILVMVNAGKAVDQVIEQLVPYLSKGDVIIDGGNSHFQDTQQREKKLNEKGFCYLGTGISGGEEGARKGPSLIPGGTKEAFALVEPYLNRIAAKDAAGLPCCTYAGPDGAGHFVKMVHNGIEYAEMQLISEIYYILRQHLGYIPEKIAALFNQWNNNGAGGFLLEISEQILLRKEGPDLLLDKIVDAAEQKGTGGWSSKAALDLGIPLDTISTAVSARMVSALKSRRVEAAALYAERKQTGQVAPLTDIQLREAYSAARIVNHTTGFALLREASVSYNWDLQLPEIARIWTGGCIIRSALVERLAGYLQTDANLLKHPEIVKEMEQNWRNLASVVATGAQNGLALPVMAASLNYFLGATTANSPANLIQAQRDYFGAHLYKRYDAKEDEHFHTNWSQQV